MLETAAVLYSQLDSIVKDATAHSWHRRDWAKSTPDQITLYKKAIPIILNDISAMMNSYGGEQQWSVTEKRCGRSYSDPNVPFAWITLHLKHTNPDTPFDMIMSFGMHAQKKRAKVCKTKYRFSSTNLAEQKRGSSNSPFVSNLPLGGQIKVVMDGAAKDSGHLQLNADCNGNIPRFFDIVSTVIDILKGSHYKYFCKANEVCRGQFSDMALKTLTELMGIDKGNLSHNTEKMELGDKMTLRFLDIPDLFEENPEDSMSDGVEEDDDDE
jgi:hypothetical protein